MTCGSKPPGVPTAAFVLLLLLLSGTHERRDIFLALSGFDTFDSRPPNETGNHDVGIVLSFGWAY